MDARFGRPTSLFVAPFRDAGGRAAAALEAQFRAGKSTSLPRLKMNLRVPVALTHDWKPLPSEYVFIVVD